jgi:hypothetical protein
MLGVHRAWTSLGRGVLASVLAGVFALVVMPIVAGAQPLPGTVLTGTMQRSLSSKDAAVGNRVVLINVASDDGSQKIAGATLEGTVSSVVRAGQGRPGKLQISITTLKLADGTVYPIDGVITGMAEKPKSNVVKEAAGAVVGMAAGNVVGKALGTGKVLGVGAGGLIGAVGGYLIARNNKADVEVAAGSLVSVQVVTPRRQAQ